MTGETDDVGVTFTGPTPVEEVLDAIERPARGALSAFAGPACGMQIAVLSWLHTRRSRRCRRDFFHSGFLKGFAKLCGAGLVFEARLYHRQVDEIALARRFPEALVVVDPLAGPVRIGRTYSEGDAFRELACLPARANASQQRPNEDRRFRYAAGWKLA